MSVHIFLLDAISGSGFEVSKFMRHLCHTNHHNISHISNAISHTGIFMLELEAYRPRLVGRSVFKRFAMSQPCLQTRFAFNARGGH